MVDNITTTTQIDPALAEFYNRVLLTVFDPDLIHNLFGKVANLPSKSGDTMKWRRYSNLTTATVPMADDGIDPPAQQLGKTDLLAKVSFYGALVHITDIVDLTNQDAVITEATKKLSLQKDQTTDELIRDTLVACASSTNASNGSNGNTPTEITKADVDAVVLTLRNADAKMIAGFIPAATGQGTSPVRPAFMGLMNTALVDDLAGVAGFLSIVQYPAQTGVYASEEGSTGNVRWLVSTKAHASSDSPVQYNLIILGQEAYGVTNLEGGNVELIIKDFAHAGSALDRYMSLGWKMSFVSRILNDNYMHILNVTHS